MAVDLAIEKTQGANLRAYVDADTGRSVGSDLVWVGWDSESMAVLRD